MYNIAKVLFNVEAHGIKTSCLLSGQQAGFLVCSLDIWWEVFGIMGTLLGFILRSSLCSKILALRRMLISDRRITSVHAVQCNVHCTGLNELHNISVPAHAHIPDTTYGSSQIIQ